MRRKDWTVKILKRFKKPLENRFDPKNAKLIRVPDSGNYRTIDIVCALCEHYKTPKLQCSKQCPFSKFKTKAKNLAGCGIWIEHVLGDDNELLTLTVPSVFWDREDNKKCRAALIRLKKAAEKLIEWV